MSRYYPSGRGSRGGGRGGGGGYYQNSYRGGYHDGGSGHYYDNRANAGGSGRYYPNRDRRDSAGGSTRNQLEIAKKLVDTIMMSGGGRRSGDHYDVGEPSYKRPRSDSYDRDRSGSQRRYSDHRSSSGTRDYRRAPEPYLDRRSRHDEFRAPPSRRPYRARGYAPRRGTGYVPRGAGPTRRSYDGEQPRGRTYYRTGRDDDYTYPSGKLMVTKCPHCHARCATFADFRKHQLGREHMAAMRKVIMKVRSELGKMRAAQRESQKELETKEAEKDAEAFEKAPAQFCTLCRLQYKDCEGVVHNETEGHKKQKAYQNPGCKTCNMVFPARIAYEKHIGTFTHIQKTAQLDKRALRRRDAEEFDKGGFMTLDSVGDVDEDGSSGRNRRASAEEEGEQVSAAQKLSELETFDGKTAVGSGYMRKTEVYHCDLCDIYIKITAKVNAVLVKHCMGKKHFENYKKKLAKMAEKEEEERAARAKAEAEAAEKEAAAAKEEGELEKTPQGNGITEPGAEDTSPVDEVLPGEYDGEEMPPDDEMEDEAPTREANDAGSTAGWEQMDDNFILGDDQEEETEKKTDGEE